MALSQTQISQLYVAIFNRASEGEGNTYWQTSSSTDSIADVATQMLATPDAQQYFGSSLDTNQAFIEAIYLNTLNKTPADDQAGIDYWVGQLDAGVSRGQVVSDLVAAVETYADAVADGSADAKTIEAFNQFNNRVEVSNYTADNLQEVPADYATSLNFAEDLTVTADDATVASAQSQVDSLASPGETFTLTTSADTLVGTAGNDTFEGTSATLQAADVIVDQSSTDNDSLNLTLTAVNAAANVSGIENVNVNWDAFGTATVNAVNFKDATVTVSSSKLGYLGNVQVNNAGSNKIVSATDANGSLDVNGATAANVDAGSAKTVTVDGSGTAADNVSAMVTAGAATTTIDVGSATAFVANTVVGGAATTSIEVNGTAGTSDSADITVVNDGTVSAQTAEIETVNITANDGQKVTLADGSLIDDLTVTSAGSVTLVAGSDELTKGALSKGLTNATAGLTVDLTSDGVADLSLVDATFNLKNALAGDLTVATGANIVAGVDLTGNQILVGTGTTDVVNLTLNVDQTSLDVVDATNDVETLNITADAAATETDEEIDVAAMVAKAVTVSGASKVSLAGVNATSVDASALTGAFTLNEAGAANASDITVVGSSTAKNTVTFATDAGDTSYTGGAGEDVVSMAQTAGDSTVVLGNGKNTYTNTTLTDGNAVVLGGTGVDTITVTATDIGANTANVVIQSGDGADVVSLGLAGADENATVDLGAGDDTIKITNATSAGDNLAIDGGAGSDTIDLNGSDLSLGTVTFANVEVIDDSTGTGVVDASELTGQTYTIKGDGNVATKLDVTTAEAGSYDFSGLVIDGTLADGIGGLSVTGNAGNDTIIGTSGNDTIASNGGNDTITGGAGVDSMTAGGGNDKFIFAAGDTGKTAGAVDSIADFNVGGDDSISFGGAVGSATNYAESDLASGAATTVAGAVTQAETLFVGTVQYAYIFNSDVGGGVAGTDAYVVYDADADGTADSVVELTGITGDGSSFAFADVVA